MLLDAGILAGAESNGCPSQLAPGVACSHIEGAPTEVLERAVTTPFPTRKHILADLIRGPRTRTLLDDYYDI